MKSISYTELDGRSVWIETEEHIETKEGQLEICAVCGNKEWPKCTEFCKGIKHAK